MKSLQTRGSDVDFRSAIGAAEPCRAGVTCRLDQRRASSLRETRRPAQAARGALRLSRRLPPLLRQPEPSPSHHEGGVRNGREILNGFRQPDAAAALRPDIAGDGDAGGRSDEQLARTAATAGQRNRPIVDAVLRHFHREGSSAEAREASPTVPPATQPRSSVRRERSVIAYSSQTRQANTAPILLVTHIRMSEIDLHQRA
jgi:hypothetical protein